MSVNVVAHPLVGRELLKLRSKSSDSGVFRSATRRLTSYLFYEHLRDGPTQQVEVETPLEPHIQEAAEASKYVLVGILRAGIPMVEVAQKLLPDAPAGFVGLERDEETLEPRQYYLKLPPLGRRQVVVMDPMLATGGSLVASLQILQRAGAESLSAICMIAAPEGIEEVREQFPDIRITLGALDKRLDHRGFILPGLGDAGDRFFGA